MNLPEKYSYLVDKKKIQFISFQTFTGLQYEQAKVDINVVPLVNNSFSNCKSELKYFESAIVGTVTCATPSHAYAKAIKNQYNGFLCKEGEWLEIFEKIYRDGHNKSLLRRIREVALKEYSGRNQLKDVERILESLYN
ncbi:MAG: glycosyltransferase [Lachnospiraceae bacterium]|nr:glycosyltransferase [Lachnospiraceae bacterium]